MSLKNGSRYLVVIFGMMLITGLVLTYTPFITDFGGAIYYNIYAGEDAYSQLSPELRDYQLFVFGVMGSLMSAWCVLLAFIAAVPLRNGERWAWNLILISVLVWYFGDSYISAATGFWIHAGLNTIFLVLIEIGLWISYRHIKETDKRSDPTLILTS